MIKKRINLHVKCPLYWSCVNKTSFLWTDFRKILKYQFSWKSGHCEPSCSMWTDVHTDRHTYMTKLIVAFLNFANAPKNCTFCPQSDFMCSVWVTQQTAIISLYNINWLVFITETESVYCAVRTGYLTFWSLRTYIYICRTAALTSRHYILNIYSTNIHTEYFKHAA